MARARNIKPGFFRNADLAELSFECRLLFAGLWILADREGRLEDRPKQIKMEIFPADNLDVDILLGQLAGCDLIARYAVDGKRYVWVKNFLKHQMPHHKEAASVIPPPPGEAQVTRHTYEVSAETRGKIFSRDGFCCLRCGSPDDLSIDHITPLSSGGDNSEENLQTLCKRCNSSKGTSTKSYVASTLNQRKPDVASTLVPLAPLIPDSGFLIPDTGSLKQAAPRAEREEATAEITPPPAAPLIGADPITVRACELAGLLRQRGAALTATNPEVRKWAEDGVSDAQALQALEVAQQRRTDKGDPSAIPAGYLTPIIRDLRNQLTGGGARASPGVSRQAAMSERNRQAAEQAKASIRAAESQRTIDAIP